MIILTIFSSINHENYEQNIKVKKLINFCISVNMKITMTEMKQINTIFKQF